MRHLALCLLCAIAVSAGCSRSSSERSETGDMQPSGSSEAIADELLPQEETPSSTSSSAYADLIAEAKMLADALRPRSHTVDEVIENIKARSEVMRRANEALAAGEITQAQRNEIVAVLRKTPYPR